ncbi:MAG TPA: DUF2997 domain-containing protein [Candidatus Bathyarchaeota archaeon]|nr:DUF2997 domain-containing protein [Candidatus Bathyarchaeota archaeon]
MREIRVTVGKDGKVKIDMIGYIGQSCLLDANRLIGLLKNLGVDVSDISTVLKPEAFATIDVRAKSEVQEER